MIGIREKQECCGCMACANICPSKCITMETDEEGFSYPKVEAEQCIACGLCDKVCPMKNIPVPFETTVTYACQSRTAEKREKSTSGGTFFELAQWVIEHDGWVCGAGFDGEGRVVHKLVHSMDAVDELLGSKYVQSRVGDVFFQIKEHLNQGCYVLFVGTPCQAAALRNYIMSNSEKLLIVDFVCFGVPSPGIYQKWRGHLESKFHKKIAKVYFRDKSYGYVAPNVKILFEDGSFTEQNFAVKSYMKLFMNELNVRPSCYACKFKNVHRASDITLGDCWSVGQFEPGMNDNLGTTGVYIHSPKGKWMFEQVSGQLKNIAIDTSKAVALDGKKMLGCVRYQPQRDDFFRDSSQMTYGSLVKKYVPDSFKQKMVNFVKPLLKNNPLFRKLLSNRRGKKKIQTVHEK